MKKKIKTELKKEIKMNKTDETEKEKLNIKITKKKKKK